MKIVDGKRLPTVTENGIFGFFGEYRFLSNFHESKLIVDGIIYLNSEAAYMAGKTDNKTIKKIFSRLSPLEARELGTNIKIIDNWDSLRISHMQKCIDAKFIGNKELSRKLLATENKTLEETNNWNDTFWGRVDGVGENNLGKCLMNTRDRLKLDLFWFD